MPVSDSNRREASLKWRLINRLGVPIAVVLALSSVGTFLLARHVGTSVYDRWLYDSAMTLGHQITAGRDHARLDLPRSAIELFEWDDTDHIFENVRTRNGRVIFAKGTFPAVAMPAEGSGPHFSYGQINGNKVRIVTLTVANPVHSDNPILIQVAETTKKRSALIAQIFAVAIPLQLGVLGLIAIAIWYAVASTLKAMHRVSDRLAAYQPDQLKMIDDIDHTPRELKPFLEAVNGLIERLAAAQVTQHRFISNAAHQLRTPLATLQVQAERALREKDPAMHREALTNMLKALDKSGHAVRQLLTLARTEETPAVSGQKVDLAELARRELESWIDAATNKEIDLGYEGSDVGVWVEGDAHLLRELIANLVDNAIRYTPIGGVVTLRLNADPVQLVIEDDGPGIAPEERTLVFERFYRGRTDQDGCGLGLAIVREIAERHKARLSISDGAQGRGTRIELRF